MITDIRVRTVIRIAILAIQWLVLTATLGASIVWADSAFEGVVEPQVGLEVIFIAAFVVSLLLGFTIESPRVLYPLTFLMCLGAASLIVVTLFAPTWAGTTVRTTSLENFATSRAVTYMLILVMPAMIGALAGNLLGRLPDRSSEILAPPGQDDDITASWWTRRSDGTPQDVHSDR